MGFGAVFVNRLRTRDDIAIRPGDYIRLHPTPKRFPVGKYNWRNRILAEEEDYLIVDKPPGIPTHATLDNAEENLVVQMSRALGQPLWVTHRLDIPAQGLVCLAKTKTFQAWFNKMLRKRRVRKIYRVLSEQPVPCGLHLAHQDPSPRAPKKMSESPTEGWLECSLTVLKVKPHLLGYETEIELHTGRTHQIRAQMALLGAPVLNDLLYGGKKMDWPEEEISLQACEIEFRDFQYKATSTLPSSVTQAR